MESKVTYLCATNDFYKSAFLLFYTRSKTPLFRQPRKCDLPAPKSEPKLKEICSERRRPRPLHDKSNSKFLPLMTVDLGKYAKLRRYSNLNTEARPVTASHLVA
jgi:hypothetical protein